MKIYLASKSPRRRELLTQIGIDFDLLLQEKNWKRRGNEEAGHRQFIVADPNGYLLRFYEVLGTRKLLQWKMPRLIKCAGYITCPASTFEVLAMCQVLNRQKKEQLMHKKTRVLLQST